MDFTATASFHKPSFPGVSDAGKKQVIKKATAYMNAWMYAIREFEDAIDDCATGDITSNEISVDKSAANSMYNSVHAWDEGVAFYIGSNMTLDMFSGVDGPVSDGGMQGKGYLAFTLGNKRCENFKTCGINGDAQFGISQQNHKLFELFTDGQHDFLIGNCGDVVPVKDKIVAQMAIPLIQGTLRYAYKVGKLQGDDEARAEGAIFAAAVLPLVDDCDPAAAKTIADEMSINSVAETDYKAVKAAFEKCYEKMGITCKEVGQLMKKANEVYPDMEACIDPTPSSGDSDSDSDSTSTIAWAIGGGVAGVLLIAVICMIRAEKQGKPMFANLQGNSA